MRIVFSSGGNKGRVAFFFSGASPLFPLRRFFPFRPRRSSEETPRSAIVTWQRCRLQFYFR